MYIEERQADQKKTDRYKAQAGRQETERKIENQEDRKLGRQEIRKTGRQASYGESFFVIKSRGYRGKWDQSFKTINTVQCTFTFLKIKSL